jgi:predicted ATPase
MLSDNPISVLIAFLRDKHLLIVLDNCEHVIAAAAALAETLLKEAPRVHILATSREPHRCEGEWVHRLLPLETPLPGADLTATEALTFPAIQLFAERASASCDSFEFCDADVPIVTNLCRRLDGIPLAIELAAARIELFGVRKLAERIEDIAYPVAPCAINILYVTGSIAVAMLSSVANAACRDLRRLKRNVNSSR